MLPAASLHCHVDAWQHVTDQQQAGESQEDHRRRDRPPGAHETRDDTKTQSEPEPTDLIDAERRLTAVPRVEQKRAGLRFWGQTHGCDLNLARHERFVISRRLHLFEIMQSTNGGAPRSEHETNSE